MNRPVRPAFARRRPPALFVAALAIASSIGARAEAQITIDPNGRIEGDLSGSGAAAALAVVDHLASTLGAPTIGNTTSTGPSTALAGDCPPVGTILDDDAHPVDVELWVTADGPDGSSRVELDITFCQVVNDAPCEEQCFLMRLRWVDLPFAAIFNAFIMAPPQAGGTTGGTTPDPDPDEEPEQEPEPTSVGGWSTQYLERPEGCHVVEIVVTPWGQVMTGEAFASAYPGHVAGFLATIAARVAPAPFDPECVTFGKP
ncbi:MAG: hypothetical protein ACF8XB_05650 [Planctomycetota bacterium JB042]